MPRALTSPHPSKSAPAWIAATIATALLGLLLPQTAQSVALYIEQRTTGHAPLGIRASSSATDLVSFRLLAASARQGATDGEIQPAEKVHGSVRLLVRSAALNDRNGMAQALTTLESTVESRERRQGRRARRARQVGELIRLCREELNGLAAR